MCPPVVCITGEPPISFFMNQHTHYTFQTRTTLPAVLLLIGVLQGCGVDSFDHNSTPISQKESIITGQIIGESVSESRQGILSSFSEAFAIPTETGLEPGPSLLAGTSFQNLENYHYEFLSDSGVHRVHFSRTESGTGVNGRSDTEIRYIFYGPGQTPIEMPWDEPEQIESVDYHSIRTGEIADSTFLSLYERTDRIFLSGLSEETETLAIDGHHTGNGTFTRIEPGGAETEREYLLEINYLDIRIHKQTVEQSRSFNKGINGSLGYESTVRQTGNGSTETKIVNGTIRLNGDGTALLKFREPLEPYRFRLEDGDLFDDDEFEGRVTHVDLTTRRITLANGQIIEINAETEIDDEDFQTLEEVYSALQNDVIVIAEGEYVQPDKSLYIWISTEVEFEIGFEADVDEFEEEVASVNITEQMFTLQSGEQIRITDETVFDEEGDFTSLAEVAEALEDGELVEVEADVYPDPDGNFWIAIRVEFESESDEP